MKKIFLLLTTILFVGCLGHDLDDMRQDAVNSNVEEVFGVSFDKNHDWCSTVNGHISVTANPNNFGDIVSVSILTKSPFGNGDANGSTSLNTVEAKYGDNVELYYDAPIDNQRLYAACVSSKGEYFIKSFNVGDESISFSTSTRSVPKEELDIIKNLPENPTLGGTIESYAQQRGYAGFENDKLYNIDNDLSLMMSFSDYDNAMKEDLRDVIFTYLPNKKSNIEKIEKHAYYNENCYPITTGKEPIIIEPIYKNDGGYKEIEKCALYYYYFKDEDVAGKDEVQYIKDLPKFRLMYLGDIIYGNGVSAGMKDDGLKRNTAYVAIFWGENPTTGSVGSYQFPEGYKIGFMLRNEGKTVHQGELYCDGRLNGEVNKWGHLASAKLGENDARMAWLSFNARNFLCIESGTDRDFNDLVLEIEGGIEPIGDIPDVVPNKYTFCFEDRTIGDYDLNDVVIKATRTNETTVEYEIMACGARDDVYIMNINGGKIKDDAEVHGLFGHDKTYINTVKGENIGTVKDKVTVPKTFSFLDESTQPYIYDKTMNEYVYLSKKGQDPHGIMIPYNFKYMLEKVCIKLGYLKFNNWGQNKYTDTDWYNYPETDQVY